jgi:hypothetical protein
MLDKGVRYRRAKGSERNSAAGTEGHDMEPVLERNKFSYNERIRKLSGRCKPEYACSSNKHRNARCAGADDTADE